MRLFKRSANDKPTALERVYFDADRGCIALALERMADIRIDFPRDAVLEYAEGCLRKDSLGQGLRALEQFRLAQKYDPSHLFSAYNAAKYSDSEKDYRARTAHARRLAPKDPDMLFFQHLDEALAAGQTWGELLTNFVAVTQQHGKHGDTAAVAEIALSSGDWSRTEEIQLRHARCGALRELDRAEDAAHEVRHEDYPPSERLALDEALKELDRVLELDPADPKMINFKSAWLNLMRRYPEAIAVADEAISIQPTGYLKPWTNKALACLRLGRVAEAQEISQRVISEAKDLGSEFADDAAKARGMLETAAAASQKPSDDELLATIAENTIRTAQLTAQEAMNLWQSKLGGFDLTRGIQSRCARYGQKWHNDYITQTAELMHDFCPEWVFTALLKLSEINQAAYSHYLHAALYVAAQSDGVMKYDASRFNVLVLLGSMEPDTIRRSYREAVLAPAASDERFAPLAPRMRETLELLNPEFPRLVADQQPIDETERSRARSVTLANFNGAPSDGRQAPGTVSPSGVLSALRSLFRK
ncbi:MAG TPA: hypothetical protein PKM57_08665 [Kiritimatiellia bacterium]|nr:hypothetical protein [Kiritimatiellia bacterium]HPS07929.1 hypothetical protein [Kiritimatiellia bacterium]